MIAELLQKWYGKARTSVSAEGSWAERIVGGAVSTAGSVRGIPGLRSMVPATPSSPLDLFDNVQRQKLGPMSYWGGQSLHIDPSRPADLTHSLTAADPALGRKRMIGAGVVGGLAAANVLGFDPMGMTSRATSAGQGAGHAFVGSSLYRAGGKTRMLGMGYLGAMGINMMRGGDNYGPM